MGVWKGVWLLSNCQQSRALCMGVGWERYEMPLWLYLQAVCFSTSLHYTSFLPFFPFLSSLSSSLASPTLKWCAPFNVQTPDNFFNGRCRFCLQTRILIIVPSRYPIIYWSMLLVPYYFDILDKHLYKPYNSL